MIYVPHDYQKYAIEFIENKPTSALLLDMGLGKTSITLTAINNLNLIVSVVMLHLGVLAENMDKKLLIIKDKS